MTKPVLWAMAIGALAALVCAVFLLKPKPPTKGGLMLYHIHDVVANKDYHYSNFGEAVGGHGFTAEPPAETYVLTYDGTLDYSAYAVTYGQAGSGWFTDSADDSPAHHDFTEQQAMKDRLKHIDDLAHGLV